MILFCKFRENASFNDFKLIQKWKACPFPLDTGRKVNVYKTFRRGPRRLLYDQFTSYVKGDCTYATFCKKPTFLLP